MAHRKKISRKRNPQIDYIETSDDSVGRSICSFLTWTKNFLKKAFLTLVLGYQFLWVVSCSTAQKSSKIFACRKNIRAITEMGMGCYIFTFRIRDGASNIFLTKKCSDFAFSVEKGTPV